MKKFSRMFATVLIIIENMILWPVDMSVKMIGKLVFKHNSAKATNFYIDYRILFAGWYLKICGIGEQEFRAYFNY